MSAQRDKLEEMLRPGIEALGFDLWGIEYQSHAKRSMLRIYIDAEAGISVDDCAKVSHQVSGVLDVEDPITGEYTLEVSSPGMDRPLYRLEQYAEYIGSDINIRLRIAFEGRRKFQGRLVAIEGDEVVIQLDGHEYLLPFEQIDRAQIVPSF
ncbi:MULTISPECIES: ribosome maturation factor RimP [Spongiibacter]|uniref:ribosome maturation factor RimP n=1 Tax=Spongiibacter TaxID=630749 RepID=UPI00195F55C2|nr:MULTISPECIES: ribosome maturation factor RimP [Spongiibacter]MBM7423490.1 ribosome maturation factor RimP [Spongiibacter marinus]